MIVNSFGSSFAPFSEITASVRGELARQSPAPIEFFEAPLDAVRTEEPEVERLYVEYLRELSIHRRFDLIILVGGPALRFWESHRAGLEPSAPVVVTGMEQRLLLGVKLGANETAVATKADLGGALETLRRSLPETRRLAVIVGDSPIERFWLEQVRREFKAHGGPIQFDWLSGLTMEEIRKRAASMPPNSAILYGMMLQDAAGNPNERDNLLESLHAVANAPIFGYFEGQLGRGIVGGSLIPVRKMAEATADVALRILAGESAGSIHTPPVVPEGYSFDWRELKRWGIPSSRLPPGSAILFRPPSGWALYKGRIVAGCAILVGQAAAIAGLLAQRRRRRKAQAALEEIDERMRLAADAAQLGIWVWNIKADEVWLTDQGRRLLGLPEAGRIDMERMISALHSEDRGAFRGAIAQSLEGGPEREEEYRVALEGDQIRWIGVRRRVELDRAGAPALMRGACIDLTDRRSSEAELQHLRAQVLHVGRVSTMGQLASTLAHELNQPLGAILSNADAAALFLQNDPPDLGEVRVILEDIRKDDERAGEVIARMRRLLKRRELEFSPVDVGELIDQAVTLLRPDAMTRKTRLEESVEAGLPPVRGDWVHLQQVLLNLMINGMDAMEGGDERRRKLTVGAARSGEGAVEISVSDTGRGIPEDKLARVFDEFFTTKQDGMGMGLPISKTIVEAHGGRLWAENNPEGGATFSFTLQPQ